MKKILFVSLLVILIVQGGLLFGIPNCPTGEEEKYTIASVNTLLSNPVELLNTANKSNSLTLEEKRGLIDRKKALKMALDVNLKFRKQWGDAVFKEVTTVNLDHKRAIMTFMVTHDVADPLSGCRIGKFNSENIDSLYSHLLELGLSSFENAVMVDYYLEAVAVESLRHQLNEIVTSESLFETYERQLEISQAQLDKIHELIEANGFLYALEDFLTSLNMRVQEFSANLAEVRDFKAPVN